MSPIRKAAIFALITGACLVLVEGLSSVVLALFQVLRPTPTEASRYDETIGWVGLPDADVPDMYGSGKYVRTNSRGFRNERETEVAVRDGKLRVLCSGNSFTYGQGVANHRTWCHRLSELDARLETVNLAQPGYGVDQMYLRYLRDGTVLDHSIHIFAFVHGDLNRMARLEQNGYGKPVLALDGGELVPDNVPVPRLRWSIRRAAERADLRAVELGRRVLARVRPGKARATAMIEEVGPIAAEVFRAVRELAERHDVVPVFVYLPTEGDLEEVSRWRGWLAETMGRLEAPFVDLAPDLRGQPAASASSFFIPPPEPGAGHYSEAGNAWVADLLFDRMIDLPRVRGRIEDRDGLTP